MPRTFSIYVVQFVNICHVNLLCLSGFLSVLFSVCVGLYVCMLCRCAVCVYVCVCVCKCVPLSPSILCEYACVCASAYVQVSSYECPFIMTLINEQGRLFKIKLYVFTVVYFVLPALSLVMYDFALYFYDFLFLPVLVLVQNESMAPINDPAEWGECK